jgi:hypothetical protein
VTGPYIAIVDQLGWTEEEMDMILAGILEGRVERAIIKVQRDYLRSWGSPWTS